MIENSYSVAVDSGKYDTKYASTINGVIVKGRFRTKVSPYKADIQSDGGASHIVEYGGKTYVVGQQASDSSVSFDTSKKLDLHRICTYAAIGQLVEDNAFVTLGIGCPLRVYVNSRDREEYRKFFYPEGGFITITIDGITKHFSIVKVITFAESSGVIELHSSQYLRKVIGVIDIGGLNLNACVYKDSFPLLDTAISEELGGSVLQQSVKERFQSEFNAVLQDYLMADILNNGYSGSRNIERQQDLTCEVKFDHVKKIYDECVKKMWPLDFMGIVFCGGASVYLRNELIDRFNVGVDCFADDAVFANALGFLSRL